MKVVNKVNTSWSKVVCWDYSFDNGYTLTMFDNGHYVARTSKGKKRYLPSAAWDALTPAEKAATNKAKAKGNAKGKQFVKQPKNIAKKTFHIMDQSSS